jgi:hypothetical protein
LISECKNHGFYVGTICPECPKTEVSPEKLIVAGQDFGRYHDYSAFVALQITQREPKNLARVLGVKPWPHVDYSIVTRDTISLYHRIGARMMGIDATDAMVEPIRTQYTMAGLTIEDIKFGEYTEWVSPLGEKEHATMKQAMIEYARQCYQEGYLDTPVMGISPDVDQLIVQLKEQEILDAKHGQETVRVRYGHPSGHHDDMAWAFLMALYVSRPFLTGNGLFGLIRKPDYQQKPTWIEERLNRK